MIVANVRLPHDNHSRDPTTTGKGGGVDVLDNIGNWWPNFLTHPTFWTLLPSVLGALAGAVSAFVLEPDTRERERIGREVGSAIALIFTLARCSARWRTSRIAVHRPRKRPGREAAVCTRSAGCPGAPEPGPSFVVGEYDFLLEDVDRKSNAPRALAGPTTP